jgi:hypothetical protein
MAQLSKGGKFVFGWSLIQNNGQVKIPQQAINEYMLCDCDKIILISGSKRTGGFCLSKKSLIETSLIKGLFDAFPALKEFKTMEGEFVRFKGRNYCWIALSRNTIRLTPGMLSSLDIKPGDKLLSIRGSNIAFVMGAKGPLIEKAGNSELQIEIF